MSALDNILSYIEKESQDSVNSIIAEAKDEANKIIADAQIQAEEEYFKILDQADIEGQLMFERAVSNAHIERKKRLLSVKQKNINLIISEARECLIKISDKDYFIAILRMVEKFALPKSGEIVFCERDYNRLTHENIENINKAASKNGGSLTVSKETREIDGGFILVYGKVEENCSFKALFENSHDSLCDMINRFINLKLSEIKR